MRPVGEEKEKKYAKRMAKRKPLTVREKQIMRYITQEINKNGYAPSVREIGAAVGLSSTATVHTYLNKLEKLGYIKKESQKGRTLRVLKTEDDTYSTRKKAERTDPWTVFHNKKELVDVPVIGKVTAGQPILAVENVTDTFPIPLEMAGNSQTFILVVRGESMIEAGILDGDYILVRRQNVAENGQMVVALIEDEATVKTFYKEKDHIRLQPENSTMDPIIVPDCKILGRVIGVIRKI